MSLWFRFPLLATTEQQESNWYSIDLKRLYKGDVIAELIIQREIRLFCVYTSVCLHACHSCGAGSCKHVQPKSTTPKQGRQLLKLLAKQDIRLHRCSIHDTVRLTFNKPGIRVSLWHESLYTSMNKALTICFFGSHANSMLAYVDTITSWLNTNRNCRTQNDLSTQYPSFLSVGLWTFKVLYRK